MTAPTNGNGSRYVSLAWLLGILTTGVVALGAAAASDMRTDIRELKEQAAEMRAVRATMDADRARLERIEAKVDRLLEDRP